MLDFISEALHEFSCGVVGKAANMFRSEVDYAATTIKRNIREGIREGLDAVRRTLFYLLIAVGATVMGLLFMVWGLAQLFAQIFNSPGLGFTVFGIVLVVVGLIFFAVSKPK